MKTNTSINDDIEQLIAEYEAVPQRVTLRVRQPRHQLKGGLPLAELERVSACRHWGVVGQLPADGPDDFEPALPRPEGDRFGG